MSHAVTVTSKLLNRRNILAACQLLGGTVSEETIVRFYDGSTHDGIVLRLPGWDERFGHVVVKPDGEIAYDDYGGSWGDPGDVAKLKKLYAFSEAEDLYGDEWDVEKEWMDDGNLKVTIVQYD